VRDWKHLQTGSAAQRQAYAVLKELRIMDVLAPYDPVWPGPSPWT